MISQLISGLLCLLFMAKRFPILHLSREDLRFRGSYAGRLCAMGIPMGLQYSITAIGCLILQAAVNTLGAVSIAAMTAGGKVGNLMCCPWMPWARRWLPTAGRTWARDGWIGFTKA